MYIRIYKFLKTQYIRLRQRMMGSFYYCGHEVYTPPASDVFERVLKDGVFEPYTVDAITALAARGSWVYDIGANIGAISVAVLNDRPDVSVLSIECSPITLAFLRKTHSHSTHEARWALCEFAVGQEAREVCFFAADAAKGAFDGLRDTGRGGKKKMISVNMKKLDEIWFGQGCPPVSVIKIDIEGGEYGALLGASKLIQECRPFIIAEWNFSNLYAHNIDPINIFYINKYGYKIYSIPGLQKIDCQLLPLFMKNTEMFVFVPDQRYQ
jgi:FkbM family methyltransferase